MIRSNKNEIHTIGIELRYNQYKIEMLCFSNRSKNRTKSQPESSTNVINKKPNYMGYERSLSVRMRFQVDINIESINGLTHHCIH